MRNLYGIFLIFLAVSGSSQSTDSIQSILVDHPSYESHFHRLFENQVFIASFHPEFQYKKPLSLGYLQTINHLPGLFCKMEYKIERKSKLAPRFRLGSLNYTDWMEGKGELYSRYLK